MSGIATKWSVLQQQTAALDDLDANGAVRTEVIAGGSTTRAMRTSRSARSWMRCEARDDLELRCRPDELSVGRRCPAVPTSLVVTATATEIWPDAFAVSVRIRPLDGPSERPLNVVLSPSDLQDATGRRRSWGTRSATS